MNARFQPTIFLPLTGTMRARIEATIENLTALLDEIDGDPDIEEDDDAEDDIPGEDDGLFEMEPDDEPDGSDERDDRDLDML